MKNTIELGANDAQIISEMTDDLEAYYRSEAYLQFSNLATLGAKMRNVHKIRNLLGKSSVRIINTPDEGEGPSVTCTKKDDSL